jgi:hypothetical protein
MRDIIAIVGVIIGFYIFLMLFILVVSSVPPIL